jgi:pimeloyl-ACP methyl ester carboxylesterase
MPTIETNGIETYYEDYGSGHPIVVLHGALADHQVWAEQLQPLTDDYRVLLYDLRGHGKTGGSDHDRYTLETYGSDLAAFIDALDLDQPVVLGHSWGGMIGYGFADAHPKKLSTLITVGAMTPESFSTGERIFQTAHTRVIMPLMTNERVLNAGMWVQETVFGDDSTPDMDELEGLRAAHECEMPELTEEEHTKILQATREYIASSWSWDLSEVPALILYGENEPFIDAHAQFLERRFTDCRSVEIPEASHNSQLDNPEFIRTRIRELLAETLDREKQRTTNPPKRSE